MNGLSSKNAGWSDQTIYDGTNIEDPVEFDYEDWKRSEGMGKPQRRQVLIWIVSFLLLVAFIFLLLR